MSDEFVLVPRKATKAMIELAGGGNPAAQAVAELMWNLMIAAAAPPTAQSTDSAKLVSELRDHANEQGRDDAAAISSWGYLRSQATRELLEKAANWIEQHDTQTAQPDSEGIARAKLAIEYGMTGEQPDNVAP